ncbi:MAG: HAMP domain-containing protein, partial [Caldilineae bacterium]
MNRLWVRLSLAFAVVALVSLAAVFLSARNISSDQRFLDFVRAQLQRRNGLAESVADYYQAHRSWEGVDVLMEGAHATIWAGERRLALTLVDPQGQILYHPQASRIGEHINLDQLAARIPVTVDGETVAYLAVLPGPRPERNRPPQPPDAGPDLLQEASVFLLRAAVLAALLGLLFGVVASWTLTAPLNQLVEGARAIGARRLDHRVPEQGSQEFREVAQAFNEMAAALEQAETLRRNLLADVAHELRTPLTVLEGNLRAILDDVYALDKEEIARLYDHTRRLHQMVDDLHELAQAEAGQLPLHRQPMDLAELAAETVDLFAPMAEEKGVTLQLEAAQPVRVLGDRTRLGQVLQNLLINALRHTPAGGQITVKTWTEADRACVQVADTGEGIAAEDLPHVFDRFYRTDKARSRDTGGAGLGLAIARALVHAHGGEITVTSQGKGRG